MEKNSEEIQELKLQNEGLKRQNEKLYEENEKLKYELDKRIAEEKACNCAPNYENEQMRMLAEIRDMLRRMEYQKDLKEVEDREKDLAQQMKNLEFDIKCNTERKANIQFEYWNRR